MNSLVYFLRYSHVLDHVAIESDAASSFPDGIPVASEIPGLIRHLPEMRCTDDITVSFIDSLIAECSHWPIPAAAKDRFINSADDFIAKAAGEN